MTEQRQQQPLQQAEGSLFGAICIFIGGLVELVAIVTVISKWTGWRFKLEGTAIPHDYGSALAFLIVGALFLGIGWTLNSLWFQRAAQGSKWTWLGFFAVLGGTIYGIIFVAQLVFYGGFLEWNVKEGTAAKVESSLKGKTIMPKRMARLLDNAVWRGNVDVLKVLFKYGAKANAWETPNPRSKQSNYRIFHRATSAGKLPVIKLFLEQGAKINTLTRDGETPLNTAIGSGWSREKGKLAIVTFLLSKGAKLGKTDKHVARNLRRRNPKIYALLRPQLEPKANRPLRQTTTTGDVEPGVKHPNVKPRKDALENETVK